MIELNEIIELKKEAERQKMFIDAEISAYDKLIAYAEAKEIVLNNEQETDTEI